MSLHNDITKYIHEFEYNGYATKIVERTMRMRPPFLYIYILDTNGNDTCIGQNNFKEEDLKDLDSVIPKIKQEIDKDISQRKKWTLEKENLKKKLNWTGKSFERGDYVYFKGNENFKPCHSYVWILFGHGGLGFYLIEHPDGNHRSNWMSKPPFEHIDGFESVHSSMLDEEIKYIQINCSDEFFNETDELTLIKKTEL